MRFPYSGLPIPRFYGTMIAPSDRLKQKHAFRATGSS
jgi:hypothetical protein